MDFKADLTDEQKTWGDVRNLGMRLHFGRLCDQARAAGRERHGNDDKAFTASSRLSPPEWDALILNGVDDQLGPLDDRWQPLLDAFDAYLPDPVNAEAADLLTWAVAKSCDTLNERGMAALVVRQWLIAEECFESTARRNSTLGCYYGGVIKLYKRRFVEGRRILEQAERQGHPQARTVLDQVDGQDEDWIPELIWDVMLFDDDLDITTLWIPDDLEALRQAELRRLAPVWTDEPDESD